MPLHLSRAHPADPASPDARALVDLHYAVTSLGPLQDILIGHDTEACRRAAAERWRREARSDPADLWLKVVDDGGRAVSAAHWKVCVTRPDGGREGGGGRERGVTLDWMEEGSEEREGGEEVLRKFYGRRRELQGGGAHVLLNRLYTHPDYQRRGCGTALVRTGCEIADRLFLPVWVESSPVGERLYRAHGFELVCRSDHIRNSKYDLSGPVLKREARGPVVVDAES